MRWGVAIFVVFVALWCHSQAATHTLHGVKEALDDVYLLKREVGGKSSEESAESNESKEAKAAEAPKTTADKSSDAAETDASTSDAETEAAAERPKRASEYVFLPRREFFANIVKQFAKHTDDSNERSDESIVTDKEVENFQRLSGLRDDSSVRRFMKSVEKLRVDPTTMGKRKSLLIVQNAMANWLPEVESTQKEQFLANIRAMVDAGADVSEPVGYSYQIKENRLYGFSLSSVVEWLEATKDPLESIMLLNMLPPYESWDNYVVYFECDPAIAARFKSDDQSDEESDDVEERNGENRKDEGDDENSSVHEENTETQSNDEESGEFEETLRVKRAPRDSSEEVRRFFGTKLTKVFEKIKKKVENLSDEFDF